MHTGEWDHPQALHLLYIKFISITFEHVHRQIEHTFTTYPPNRSHVTIDGIGAHPHYKTATMSRSPSTVSHAVHPHCGTAAHIFGFLAWVSDKTGLRHTRT